MSVYPPRWQRRYTNREMRVYTHSTIYFDNIEKEGHDDVIRGRWWIISLLTGYNFKSMPWYPRRIKSIQPIYLYAVGTS